MQYTQYLVYVFIKICTCFCAFNMIYYCRGKPESQAAHPLFIGGATLQTKERRDANVCYIFGFNPDRYIHCFSYRIVLYDLWEKEIAATTRNSDG